MESFNEKKYNLLIIKNATARIYNFKTCGAFTEDGYETSQCYFVTLNSSENISTIILQYKYLDTIQSDPADNYEIYAENVIIKDIIIECSSYKDLNVITLRKKPSFRLPIQVRQFKFDILEGHHPDIRKYENITESELELLVEMEKLNNE